MVGGFLGYGMVKALTVGFDRGVFATDAGTGIVPILQSAAKTKSPVVDEGVVTLIAPFMVMVMCTTTGLVLLVTGAADQLDIKSTEYGRLCFFSSHGIYFRIRGCHDLLIIIRLHHDHSMGMLRVKELRLYLWVHLGQGGSNTPI
jgi:Na+/alanine symporter